MRQNSPGSFLVIHRVTHPESQICVSLPAGDAHHCVGQHLAHLAVLYCLAFISPRGLSLCITRSNVLGHPSGHSASLKGFTHTGYCCMANASFFLRYCSLQWRWSSLYSVEFLKGGGKGKGSGVWPSMVTHTRNLSSAFNPSKCTLTAVNTHLEQWAAILRRPGTLEQLCLAQGSHLSRGIEGGESTCYSLPPPTIPAGPGNRTGNLWVTSPTL